MKTKNIVLLHGWGANVKKLEPLAGELKRLGWNVLIPELPGFDAPEPKDIWTLEEYSEYVSSWSEKAFKKKPYFVFGHSFGGRVAIKMSMKNKFLEGIILCATGGISRGSFVKRIIFQVLAKIGGVLGLGNVWKKVIYKLAREHDYEKASKRMKEIFKKVVEEDLKAYVPKIKIPVLILWGKQDRVTPLKDAYFLSDNLKTKHLVVFDNVGHRLPYERFKEISQEVNQWINNF